jgi:HD-GYP domain-containing protein (c-di-GMP phosphodiesterase class II)
MLEMFMKIVEMDNINEGSAFTEDSYILDNLFFIPKNLPIQKYHIDLLRKWEINGVLTDGEISKSEKLTRLIQDKPNVIEESLKAIENEKDESEKANEEVIDIPKPEESKIKLLDNTVKTFIDQYKNWIKYIYKIFNDIILKKEVDKESVKNFINDVVREVNKNRNNALMLFGKKIEGVLYIYPKTIETLILSYIIGDGLQLPEFSISNLLIATLFHDIGMLKIPKTILEKKEALTEGEILIIKNHPINGYNILREVKYSAIIASGALQHHERLDGKGYPNGLPKDKITEIAKIISVVDAYCGAIA